MLAQCFKTDFTTYENLPQIRSLYGKYVVLKNVGQQQRCEITTPNDTIVEIFLINFNSVMLKFLNPMLNHAAWGLSQSLTRSFSALNQFDKIRNIGISAHIDSGKTTFSERVLFYAGKINSIHEVKGSDSVGATMDFMELEREKGITIQSAATHLKWRDYSINLIDTPGHVDFTIEVERALRVLDGAILILCGVGGVQPQTLTVNKQMIRYNVPRIIFVNKLDRMGANPWSAIHSAREKLGICCAAVQVPMGEDDRLRGLIDIVKKRAYYFDGANGQNIREEDVPQQFNKIINEKHTELVGQLANLDPELEEMFLEEKVPSPEVIEAKIRQYTLERKFIPVFMGSAYKNKGVQLALDGVLKYLPSPLDKKNYGYILNKDKKEEMVQLLTDEKKPFVGYVFKLEESKFGQLTYIRVYQGKLKRGEFVWNDKLAKKLKVSRIVKMHANNMEEVEFVKAGDIFAIFGVDCSTGDTLSQADNSFPARCQSMFVPDPVMSLTIKPAKHDGAIKLEKALSKFKREDPTFTVNVDKESEEMIISGMGELHLQIYVERINREFGVQCSTGQPGVNYRETILQRQSFDYLHKKQTGGAGQYARVIGYIEPVDPEGNETACEFVSKVVGTNIPPEYVTAVGKAFKEIVLKGPQTGYPVINTRFVLEDGATHVVDSSANAFAIATRYAFHKAMQGANQQVLEPMMDVEVNVNKDIYQGVMSGILKRRGSITKTETRGDLFCLKADVPLREMFGYAMELRGLTSGEGEFSMEYKKHTPMPPQDAKVAIEKYKAKRKEKDL